MSDPVLSIITSTRNDNYDPDNLYRLSTSLNLSGLYLSQSGRLKDVEFIVVDFKGSSRLSDNLILSEEAASITRFINVPRETSGNDSDGLANQFLNSVSVNIGVRRAQGRFIATQGQDLLTSYSSWCGLFHLLTDDIPLPFDRNNFSLAIPRRAIPLSFIQHMPSIHMIDRWLKLTPHSNIPFMHAPLMHGHPQFAWGMGSLLAPKSVWYKLQGLDERFNKWGFNDIDFGHRASMLGPVIDGATFGIYQFKPEHSPIGERAKVKDLNPMWINSTYQANDTNWGMRGTFFPESRVVTPKAFTKNDSDPEHSILNSNDIKISTLDELLLQINSENTVNIVSRAVAPNTKFPTYQIEIMKFIAWYCEYKMPKSILELGYHGSSFNQNIYALTVPAAEITLIEHIIKDEIGKNATILHASENLKKFSFSGCTRGIIGDTLKLLDSAFSDENAIYPELIFINLDNLAGSACNIIEKCMRRFDSPQCIIMHSISPSLLKESASSAYIGSKQIILKSGMASIHFS